MMEQTVLSSPDQVNHHNVCDIFTCVVSIFFSFTAFLWVLFLLILLLLLLLLLARLVRN